jgi:DNA-binding transcriptional MerR regulator
VHHIDIPNKLFFRIGEVSKLLQLEPYVLRFWETEFPMLTPTKGANGRRMYRKKDVEMVVTIKSLLYERGFTIAGAKRVLAGGKHVSELGDARSDNAARQPAKPDSAGRERLDQIKSELRTILTLLNRRC